MAEADHPGLPLHGVRVVDASRMLPGALATLLLADLGADVVKLEMPPRGDHQRDSAPAFGDVGAAFAALNRDKRSVCLDYRTPAGLAAVHRLLDTADVFVENAIPGALRARGLDYGTLHARLPRLVYCSLSAFGQSGPFAARPGHGVTIDAEAGQVEVVDGPQGALLVAAMPGGGLRPSVLHAGHLAAMAVCAALRAVAVDGRGSHVDAACWDAAAAADPYRAFQDLNGVVAAYGTAPARPSLSVFATADGRRLVVAAPDAASWRRWCALLDRPDLEHAAGTEWVERSGRAVRVYDELAAAVARRPLAEWAARLTAERVAFGVVEGRDRFESALARSRDIVRTAAAERPVADPAEGVRWVGAAASFDGRRGRVDARPAPRLGADTVDLLAEVGMSRDEIAEALGDGRG